MSTATKRHHDTSEVRCRQARSQAYWIIDNRWPHNVSNAVDAINEQWSAAVDAIMAEDRDTFEARNDKILLLISRIRRA